MASAEAILDPYVRAADLRQAEHELDALASRSQELPVSIGDLYDGLAEAAADDDEYEQAARLEAKAIAAGCRDAFLARAMQAWYLLKAGATDKGEALFRTLCAERPDDASVRLTLAQARSDAGLQDAALDAFDDALATAKRSGFPREIDRARIERRAEREHVGLPLDADDRLAPAPAPLPSGPVAWSIAWFAPAQRDAALIRWPELAEDFDDPQRYARRIEGHLRDLRRALGANPAVAPIDVQELVQWARTEGYDPDSGEARSMFAAELARTGRAIAWPPGRNEPCWCGSTRKYKRCCGEV